MRNISILIVFVLIVISFGAHAQNQETNVNVVLEIEGEYKIEAFKEPSEGLGGLVNTGTLRVIRESEAGLPKYTALNDAMQKARRHVWSVIQDSYITNELTVGAAVKNAPAYFEYKEKDEEDKAKLAAMTPEERKAFIEKNGKEKKYDYDKFLDIVKECGQYKKSGRFYDAVEEKGYVCLRVELKDFFAAVQNDKINIFKELNFGERYRPMDNVQVPYDGIIINASDIDYVPSFYVKVLSPTEETVYAGLAGKRKVFFAKDIEEAKHLLGENGAKRVYNTPAIGETGKTGIRVNLPAADRIYSAVSKDKNIPFVIIYKTEQPEEEDTIPAAGE